MIEPFPQRYRKALSDNVLRVTLLAFQRGWRANRDAAISGMDFEGKRARLVAAKNDVIAHEPEYLERFTLAAQAAGATTYMAASGEDAVRTITEIAAARGARRVVKSKSMASEEIDLNHGLEAAGLHVVETDLGEWIVQLAGERPSHIVGPALHMNRRQIADLFSRATGISVSRDNIAEQVAFARRTLREEFIGGEIGISGANALIAESGTVMIVTNEGNAELVTSLPPVHIVLAGIEKLVPALDDAMTQLDLLAPSATGQRATSYVTFVTGPGAPDRELHIVLLDNGRSRMREDPRFVDALRCIRCGACSSVCPSYAAVGGHVFGYVYSGAIGLVNTPFHHSLEHDQGPQSLCVSCNACQTVCPVNIPLPRQILDTRAEVVDQGGMAPAMRAGIELFSRPAAFRLAARAGGIAELPIQRGPFVEPPLFRDRAARRKPPALARRPFRDRWREDGAFPAAGPLGRTLQGVRIAYFVQCLTDWIYPEMGVAVVDALRRLGATVVFPRAQHCCGLPALDSGAVPQAKRMARQTITVLEAVEADYIVTGGTSCAVAMLHDYGHLFRDEPTWRTRAEALSGRVMDFTTFIHRVARLPAGSLASSAGPATYHYFCQSYNVLGFRREPLHLLGEVCGVDLAPLPEANVCCGFGGSVSLQRPEACELILERKLANVRETGVETLITDNPGCIMHLRGGLAATGSRLQVRHTAEVVADALRAIQ